jgi:RNA polymerase sigma-70 factor, ECF subfamily
MGEQLLAASQPRGWVNEGDLIDRVVGGDSAAERAFYDAHVDRVYRLAYRLAGDDDVARDITQDTFIRAFEHLGTFRRQSSLATWLHSITVSVGLNRLRTQQRAYARETALSAVADPVSAVRIAEPDLKERMAQAIEALPTGYRTVFVMHDVEGFTHEEIGAALRIDPGTSKAQLSRARGKLRRTLADFAGDWRS